MKKLLPIILLTVLCCTVMLALFISRQDSFFQLPQKGDGYSYAPADSEESQIGVEHEFEYIEYKDGVLETNRWVCTLEGF